LKRKKRNRPR